MKYKNRYFIFNDINSFSKGVILKSHPIITSPALRGEAVIIEGRSGSLHYNQKVYDTFIRTIECILIDPNTDIREISKWLKGEGKLIFSNELDKFYKVNIINQIDFTNIADKIHVFPLIVEFQPFAYSVEEKNVTITESKEIIIPKSTATIYPKIKVYGNGNGTITFNNKSQVLYDITEYIELDSELEIAYKKYENKNSSVYGEYLTLEPGKNEISLLGNIDKIEITYRETYI